MRLINQAPDSDCIIVEGEEYRVTVSRDEDGKVWVVLEDLKEGGEEVALLGFQGSTTKA